MDYIFLFAVSLKLFADLSQREGGVFTEVLRVGGGLYFSVCCFAETVC